MNVDFSHWPEWLIAAFGGAAGLKGLGWAGFVKTHGAPMVTETLKTNTDARDVVKAIVRDELTAHDLASAEKHRGYARTEIEAQTRRDDGEVRKLVDTAVAKAVEGVLDRLADMDAKTEERERAKEARADKQESYLRALAQDFGEVRGMLRQIRDTPRPPGSRDPLRLPPAPPTPPAPRRPTPALGVERIDTDE